MINNILAIVTCALMFSALAIFIVYYLRKKLTLAFEGDLEQISKKNSQEQVHLWLCDKHCEMSLISSEMKADLTDQAKRKIFSILNIMCQAFLNNPFVDKERFKKLYGEDIADTEEALREEKDNIEFDIAEFKAIRVVAKKLIDME